MSVRYDVFISYDWNWIIKKDIVQLCNKLKASGLKVWQYERKMSACNINNEMPQVYELDLAIRRSSIFLSCITQKYCGSHSCHHELEYANKLKKPIAFLFIENVKAKDLSNLCGVDINPIKRINCYEKKNWTEAFYDEILRTIQSNLENKPTSDTFLKWKACHLRRKPSLVNDALEDVKRLIQCSRFTDAINSLEKIIEEQSYCSEAHFIKGFCLAELQRHAEASESYEKAILLNPNFASAHFNNGLSLLKLNKTMQAIESFDKAIQINPEYELAYYHKGHTLFELSLFERSVDCFSKAIELNTLNSSAYWFKALALDELERFEEAKYCYNKTIELNPQFIQNTSKYMSESFCNLKLLEKAIEYYERGLRLCSFKEYELAVSLFNKAIGLNPHSERTLIKKAVACTNLNQFEEALECYNQVIQINPSNGLAHVNKGKLYLKLNLKEKATECFDKAAEIISDCDLRDVLFNKGIALDGLQQYDKAIECFNACIELNDQDELAYIAKGNALDNMKHSKQAIREYDRAIQINEKNESVFFNKGVALLNLKEYEKAILCNDNAIKLNALCAPAHCNKGVALFHLNRFTEALAEYNKAIEINPNYSDAYFNREITLEKMGKKLDDSLSKKTDGVLLMNSSKLQSFNKTIDINTLFS